MQCYTELIPPTGVTQSVSISFTGSGTNELIVTRSSLLQIFALKTINATEEARLVLISEYSLQGTISGLAKVTLAKSQSGGDALLISFRDAKLSLVEWDPSQHSISTISIHYYENHDLLLSPWSPDLKDCVTRLTVDPSSRCAAFNFNQNSLAIIPFRQAQDDLAMDDDFDDLDDDKPNDNSGNQQNGDVAHEQKLSFPSFVLSTTDLDPGLVHPIDIVFLHEYRQPTVGVLFSSHATSMNMAPIRRDGLSYAVYTLDIEQKAVTTLTSVTALSNDLHQVVALPAPLGGALLIGGNELVHIDQGGRVNAVAVNEFSKDASSLAMADESGLQLRLEGCRVQSVAKNEMLLITNEQGFALLTFRIDGRSVSGLSVQKVDLSYVSPLFTSSCSTTSDLQNGYMFLGSEEGSSVLVSATRRALQLKRTTSRAYLDATNGELDGSEEEDEDDDDLYADSKVNGNASSTSFDPNSLIVKDVLHSIAPLHDVVLGRPSKRKREDDDDMGMVRRENHECLDLVAACNSGTSSSLAFLSRSVKPKIVKRHRVENASMVWAMTSEASELEPDARPFDDMLVFTQGLQGSTNHSSLFSLSPDLQEKGNNDFERGDRVVATGRLVTGSHVVVYTRDIRAYNKDFGLDQIFAIVDEEMDATAEVQSAWVTDTHILVKKTDNSISLLKVDKSGDLDEVVLPHTTSSENIISASLFDDHSDFFDTNRYNTTKDNTKALVLVLLTSEGRLSLHPVANLDIEIFSYLGLDYLPHYLSPDQEIPKHWRSRDTITQIALSHVGSAICEKPYLIVRHGTTDVTIYEPYSQPGIQGSYRFTKSSCHIGDPRNQYNEQGDEDTDSAFNVSLLPLSDVAGTGVVVVTGKYPCIITRSSASPPRVHHLDVGPVQQLSPFHDSSCNRGFVYVDQSQYLTFCEIPRDIILDHNDWAIRKVEIGEEVSFLTFHPRTGTYVLATSRPAPFHLPRDDEWRPEWTADNEKATPDFLPTTRSYSIKLISAVTHSIISEHQFGQDEQVLSLKCLNIEVSEQTHERKDVIVVGTGFMRGENVVTRGMLYLFDIVDVVPHPDIPETDLKLKLITSEDVRGAVTTISPIGTQGFILAAQGQKCMVRGLREDNAILPVAFMDMRFYVSVAKELPGTGMTILADAYSGLWLIGYSEEPYKMQLLGRDLENPSISAAEFMPIDKQLFIIAADGNGDLRILQYDPWNPKTERGSILLQRSTFNTGYFPKIMALLPRTPTPSEALVAISAAKKDDASDDGMQAQEAAMPNGHQVLIATREGALVLITPLSDQAYRRLSTLQTTLITQLDQYCGLNPRAHRQVETDGTGGRAMIDGQIVKRWVEQSSQHKAQLADRVGGTLWEVRSDLEAVGGAGLGFL